MTTTEPDWTVDGVDGWQVAGLAIEYDATSQVVPPETRLAGVALDAVHVRALRGVLDAILERDTAGLCGDRRGRLVCDVHADHAGAHAQRRYSRVIVATWDDDDPADGWVFDHSRAKEDRRNGIGEPG